MPSLNTYKKMIGTSKSGSVSIADSHTIVNYTWWDDPSAKVAYLYDWYHDDEPTSLVKLSPEKSKVKVPIDIKYIINASSTMDKDAVTKHIQLRPHQKCNVPYYDEFFTNRYGSAFPIGLYIDIPDSEGIYNRWLVCAKANYEDTMFPTYEVLPCDYVVQYVFDGKCYQVPGVLRSQNS